MNMIRKYPYYLIKNLSVKRHFFQNNQAPTTSLLCICPRILKTCFFFQKDFFNVHIKDEEDACQSKCKMLFKVVIIIIFYLKIYENNIYF